MSKFEIGRYAAAGYPVLAVETHEEERLVRETVAAFKVAGGSSRHILLWDIIGGLRTCTSHDGPDESKVYQLLEQPVAVPEAEQGLEGAVRFLLHDTSYAQHRAILILRDPHPLLNDPGTVRLLRVVQPALKERGHLVLMVAPQWSLPSDLRCEVTLLDFPLPEPASLEAAVEEFVKTNVADVEGSPYGGLTLPDHIKTASAEALQGLTHTQAENALSLAVTTMSAYGGIALDGKFVQLLFQEKVQQLKTGLLEYLPTGNLPPVAGLGPLREWAQTRRFSFTKDAREMGLPYPLGAVLVGVPGCGKTVMAGEFARIFNLPLFKLDIGRLFASKVGETESLTREVIRQMNSLGGAVVLIDELEQSLSKNATSGGGDSGTSSRMFGTLLNWLSTKTCPVFLVATSNNIDSLPPQLTRVGRFDAIFWVDLPTVLERQAILQLKFKPYHEMTLETVIMAARQTEGYTGAELTALVTETTLRYFGSSDRKESDTYGRFLLDNLALVKPQQNGKEKMKQMRETVEARGWLRANPADKESKLTAKIGGRKLNIGNN